MSSVYIKVATVLSVLSAAYIFTDLLFVDNFSKENPNKIYTLQNTNTNSNNNVQRQPNIVLIIACGLGFNDVSYNGKLHGSAISTPNIDSLAAEGVTLDNYYVQPLCTPTRASLMTGRYSIHLGLQHRTIDTSQPLCLPLDEVTLPEKLKEVGYATHAVGKWHLGFYKEDCLPTKRGFDTFFGYYGGMADNYMHNVTGDFDGRSNLTGYDLHRDTATSFRTAWRQKGQYSTEMLSSEAQNLIRRHVGLKQPLFLYLPFLAVHSPLQVPNHYKRPYEHLIADENRQTMAGMVGCFDEAIGDITNTLKEAGLYDDTIILFSSDHGGSVKGTGNNWPLRGTKNTLWEGGIRSVGFIHSPLLPNKVRGTTSQAFIHVSDWFPTIVSSLAGGSLSGTKPLDGYDVWDSLATSSSSPRTELLHNIDPIPYDTNTHGHAVLRMGDWKLLVGHPDNTDLDADVYSSWYPPPESGLTSISPVEPPGKNIWLFNIATDPTEKYDMSDERPGIVKRMLERLKEYNQTMVPPLYPDLDPNSDPALNGGVWGPWE